MKLVTGMYCIILYVISSRKKASNLIEFCHKNSIKVSNKENNALDIIWCTSIT
jgi:hypothetical protein